MQYLPVCLQLRDAPVVLVGGGKVAVRKARLLGEDWAVFRTPDGEYGIVAERCPHRGASLVYGIVSDHGGTIEKFMGEEFTAVLGDRFGGGGVRRRSHSPARQLRP